MLAFIGGTAAGENCTSKLKTLPPFPRKRESPDSCANGANYIAGRRRRHRKKNPRKSGGFFVRNEDRRGV